MTVAFRHLKHDISLSNTLLAIWTNSKFTHVQIIFSNGDVGSSGWKEGVKFKTINETIIYPWLWTFIKIESDQESEQLTYNFIKSQLGVGFDKLGYITQVPNRKWFCSEICFVALKRGGIIRKHKNLVPTSISPQRLYDILEEEI